MRPPGALPSVSTLGIALDPELIAPYNPEKLRLLPLRPLPMGFAINTAFYAAILWLLILGPFALRRLIRARRGLCPACAYPMGESDMCSECGRPLPKSVKAATS